MAGGRPMAMGGGVSEDDFNVGDAFQGWFQCLISPKSFFEEQIGTDGIKGPSSFVLAYAIAFHVVNILAGFMMGQGLGGRRIGNIFFGWACLYCFFMVGYFIWGTLVHLASKMFGGQGNYSVSFRAGAWGSAPMALMGVVSLLTLPLVIPKEAIDETYTAPVSYMARAQASVQQAQGPVQYAHAPLLQGGIPSGPTGMPSGGRDARSAAAAAAAQMLSRLMLPALIIFVGWIWSLVTTGIAISTLHEVGTGQAVGATIVAVILNIVLQVAISFAIGAAIMSFVQQFINR